MDLPTADVEVKPEKLEQVKEASPMFHCDLCDTEVIYKIAQEFLPGLASACVDNTTGDLFRTPASVAVDMRKEMVEYLTQRSESFVAETVILEGGPEAEASDHPLDIISDFVDDFASLKRNLFSRVSGWLLSERREDRIDDFVQEMEINGFWLLDRREVIAQTLLRNVDFKNTFHCNMKFNSAKELGEHALKCSFRTMTCTNQGCTARFCSAHLEDHDSVCPFKILPCEQKCSDSIMRREMDRHCITICPMKLMNCPFYQVGCESIIPQCTIEQHRLEYLHSHLVHILQVIHKDASVEDLKERVNQIEKASSPGRLAEAWDARSLTYAIKDIEGMLGPLPVSSKNKVSEECAESPTQRKDSKVLPSEKQERIESTTKKEVCSTSPTGKTESNQPPSKEEQSTNLSTNRERIENSPTKKESYTRPGKQVSFKSSNIEEDINKPLPKTEGFSESVTKRQERTESPTKKQELAGSLPKREECRPSPNFDSHIPEKVES